MLLSEMLERARDRLMNDGLVAANCTGTVAVGKDGKEVRPYDGRAVRWTIDGILKREVPSTYRKEAEHRLAFAHLDIRIARGDKYASSSTDVISGLPPNEVDAVFRAAIGTVKDIERIAFEADCYGFGLSRSHDIEWAAEDEG